MKFRQRLLRLVGREYLPLAITGIAWLIIAAYCGTADAARLLGATMLFPSVRALTALDVGPALVRRLRAPDSVYRHAVRLVLRLQALSFLAAGVFLAVAFLLLSAAGHEKASWFLLLIGIGLPSRYLSTVGVGRRRPDVYRSALALSGLGLITIAIAADAGVYAIAFAWGLREWLALGVVLLPWPTNSRDDAPITASQLSWREIASVTAARSKRQLTHQLGKRFLSMFIGPFGALVARTGRDFGVDRRLSKLLPHSFLGMLCLAMGSTMVGIGLILMSTEPAAFVVAASVLRIAAVSVSLVIWWQWSANPHVDDEYDEDD